MSSIFSKVHLYDSPEKAVQECEGLYELPERQENDLSHMEEPSEKKIHYDRYFMATPHKSARKLSERFCADLCGVALFPNHPSLIPWARYWEVIGNSEL